MGEIPGGYRNSLDTVFEIDWSIFEKSPCAASPCPQVKFSSPLAFSPFRQSPLFGSPQVFGSPQLFAAPDISVIFEAQDEEELISIGQYRGIEKQKCISYLIVTIACLWFSKDSNT